ncbi:hypothetical protein [Sphaerimonospora thailandensis]|uniref:Uncharacterized protein n=1 Tax=Sphaerimonospora thailandensis TaxID=795644 RepID=A0A8J3R6P9_9ACTN|nr:hypothetical protein [Sphaerimonospora thailandensis]GIH70117.1 hypothetical protein Mth01_23700 [Sphaerimonospora thailandensis]
MHHDLSVLADRDCLVAFAAIVLSSDNAVRDHEMGYSMGGGIGYITVHGVTRRTGLSRTAAERALHRLEAAGVATANSERTGWRTDVGVLTGSKPARGG